MFIKHKIRSSKGHFVQLPSGSKFVLGISDAERLRDKVVRSGLSFPLNLGESVLPAATHGPACRENANGWLEVHRDRPKETAYRSIYWTWRMKRGWDYEEDSKTVDVPYQRFPRTKHPPHALEIAVRKCVDDRLVVTMPVMTMGQVSERCLVTAVNAMVEMYGECEIMRLDDASFIQIPLRHLNWEILPQGEVPWERIERQIKEVCRGQGNRTLDGIQNRLDIIKEYKPDFHAVGRSGFAGYIIFGFKNRGLYVLESIRYGNATYGLEKDWEQLSQLSKAALIQNGLNSFRFVHSAAWERNIRDVLGRRAAA